MPPISLLIKPASSNCNLRCKYCFYHSLAENRRVKPYGIMNTDTLEVIVKKALEYADYECTFAFQGGEPTLAGLNFFEKLIELEKKYNCKKAKINNTIQTNGIAIDESFAKFLSDNNFLVGLSLDGPKDIHDANRTDLSQKGSFSRVMNTIALFNKYKVEYNILSVVNAYTVKHAGAVYNFFKKQGFRYLQFIQCLDPLEEMPGRHEYSLEPSGYAHFLKSLFDLWYEDFMRGKGVSIRYFDNLAGILMGYPAEACGMNGRCQCQFVIEADGSVYPCDFYVMDDWLLGNIKESGFDSLQNCDAARKFIEESKYIDSRCGMCKYFNLCRGGCRRLREPFSDGKPALNYYCAAYMEFFDYAVPRLYQMLAAI